METKNFEKHQKTNGFLMPPHPLTTFKTQKYYHNHAQRGLKNETRFNGVYSRDNIPKIKYVINLDECSDIGTHWVALYVKINDVNYSDTFCVEHIPKEIKKFISNKNIKTNIFRIQAYDSIMCGYFCIGFINFMFKGKSLTDYTNLFSRYDFKKNDNVILNYFMSNKYV